MASVFWLMKFVCDLKFGYWLFCADMYKYTLALN